MEDIVFLLQRKFLWATLLSLLFTDHAFSQFTYNWLSIDCGARTRYKDKNGIDWRTDEDYIKTGQNQQVQTNGLAVSDQLGTLRFFNTQNKNCYRLPSPDKVKYIIRAGFYYGNYDGLGEPPVFDLAFDENKWATVVTSMDEPVFYEMIYATEGDGINICVARTLPGHIPFISSLESMPLPENMYDKMNRNFAWFLSYRVHFGRTDVIGYPQDDYNRIWKPFSTPDLTSVTANFTELSTECVDDPPLPVILNAVEGDDANSSISLPFDFPKANRSNYIALYFTEVIQLSSDEERSFTIAIDGRDYGLSVTPQYQVCNEVNVTTDPAFGAMNISISPTGDSTLPPLISAAEVYTVSPTLVASGTNQADLDGLQTIISSFSQLQGWTGDPCLPNSTVWEWLSCNRDDPPTVTALYLTGYGLEGSIPKFDQMQALEIIYMDSNKLSGMIPDFLGNLPNLKLLNLAYNNLNGVPSSLINNNHLSVNLTGNPIGEQPPPPPSPATGKESKSGDALWSLVSLVLVGVGIWYCCRCCCCGSTDPDPDTDSTPGTWLNIWIWRRERTTTMVSG